MKMNQFVDQSKVTLLDENTFNPVYQQCIIKEEIIISDMSDVSDNDEEMYNLNKENMQYSIKNETNYGVNENYSIDKQSSILNFSRQYDDYSFKKSHAIRDNNSKVEYAGKDETVAEINLAIRKFGKAFCQECNIILPVVRHDSKCKSCQTSFRYNCLPCNKSYKRYSYFTNHLKIKHLTLTSSNFHACYKCNKIYVEFYRLKEHVKGCGKPDKRCKEMRCTECPYVAKYKSNLVNHVKSRHATTTSCVCKCGKKYTNQRSLKRHMQLYCGKKKTLKCDECGYKAFRKDQLVNHFKAKHPTLYEPNAFQCKMCKTKFKSLYKLRLHVKTCIEK